MVGCRVQGSRFRISGLKFDLTLGSALNAKVCLVVEGDTWVEKDQGLGLRVERVGFRVWM